MSAAAVRHSSAQRVCLASRGGTLALMASSCSRAVSPSNPRRKRTQHRRLEAPTRTEKNSSKLEPTIARKRAARPAVRRDLPPSPHPLVEGELGELDIQEAIGGEIGAGPRWSGAVGVRLGRAMLRLGRRRESLSGAPHRTRKEIGTSRNGQRRQRFGGADFGRADSGDGFTGRHPLQMIGTIGVPGFSSPPRPRARHDPRCRAASRAGRGCPRCSR